MTRKLARQKAEANGHRIGNFKARYWQRPFSGDRQKLYSVAWCEDCQAAIFCEGKAAERTNPAIDRKCQPTRAGEERHNEQPYS